MIKQKREGIPFLTISYLSENKNREEQPLTGFQQARKDREKEERNEVCKRRFIKEKRAYR